MSNRMPRIQGWHTGAGESSDPGIGWSSQTGKKKRKMMRTVTPRPPPKKTKNNGNVTRCLSWARGGWEEPQAEDLNFCNNYLVSTLQAETNMVWNVKIVIGQSDTVPAHLVDQVFPDNDDLLAAVLDPDRKKQQCQSLLVSTKKAKVWVCSQMSTTSPKIIYLDRGNKTDNK